MRSRFPWFRGADAVFASEDACSPERQAGGVTVGDADGDERPDGYVTCLDRPGILFHNAGWADLDNDGAEDLVATTVAARRLYYFHNDGSGHFTEQAITRGLAFGTGTPLASQSVNFGDYDGDGYLDVHLTEWRMFDLGPNAASVARLLPNRGAVAPGHFEATDRAGVNLKQPTRPAWSFSSASSVQRSRCRRSPRPVRCE